MPKLFEQVEFMNQQKCTYSLLGLKSWRKSTFTLKKLEQFKKLLELGGLSGLCNLSLYLNVISCGVVKRKKRNKKDIVYIVFKSMHSHYRRWIHTIDTQHQENVWNKQLEISKLTSRWKQSTYLKLHSH